MADQPEILYAYAPEVIESVRETALAAVRNLLDHGTVLALNPPDAPPSPAEEFEAWVIERWLAFSRSPQFKKSARYQRLAAIYARERGYDVSEFT